MSQWIRQSMVPSISRSARSRTAYLSSFIPQVRSAIQTYLDDDPSGEEVTLAVMQAIGLESLNAVRKTRSLTTAKQDVGLLVATTLVDLYGATEVETYRRPNVRSVSSKRNTWKSIPWVSSFTPHRVRQRKNNAPRILLDTSVVRKYIHQDPDALDIDALDKARGQHPVSVADGALSELAAALLRGSVKPSDWGARVGRLNALLDAEFPVAPGGRELAALWGGHRRASGDRERASAFSQASWSYLCEVKRPADLTNPVTFSAPSLGTVSLRLDRVHVEAVLAHIGREWADWATRTADLIHDLRGAGEVITVGVLYKITMHTLCFDMGEADAKKLDLVAHVLALRAFQAAQKHAPYVPKGASNDALDLDLLFGLPLPAWVCTQDHRLHRLVRSTPSSDALNVMTPEELIQRILGQ